MLNPLQSPLLAMNFTLNSFSQLKLEGERGVTETRAGWMRVPSRESRGPFYWASEYPVTQTDICPGWYLMSQA